MLHEGPSTVHDVNSVDTGTDLDLFLSEYFTILCLIRLLIMFAKMKTQKPMVLFSTMTDHYQVFFRAILGMTNYAFCVKCIAQSQVQMTWLVWNTAR